MTDFKTSFNSILALEDNPKDVYLETTTLLLKLIENVIQNPSNPKFRSVRLGNPVIANKLLPVVGAMECLFEMGFQEGDDCLILPSGTSLENLKRIRDEISVRRKRFLSSSKPKETTLGEARASTSSQQTVQSNYKEHQSSFLSRIAQHFHSVLKYEDKALQAKTLSLIPLKELEIAAQEKMRNLQRTIKQGLTTTQEEEVDIKDVLLVELLNWFKNSFFKWMDSPSCHKCSGVTKFTGHSTKPEDMIETGRVEVYRCSGCGGREVFPRYNDPAKLLQTRRGRCGEWANCFTLMCRALGWDSRLVVDETDHVWTEVYSATQRRWLHCDPCENVCDSPLMYEVGWGKQLTYVMAYSSDDVQDVTWRYSCRHEEVVRRRTLCSEDSLLRTILQLRKQRQEGLSAPRRAYLTRRLLAELVEFLSVRDPTETEQKGRSSGSLVWRLSRGEVGPTSSYVWQLTGAEKQARRVELRYSTARDKYERVVGGEELPGWQHGVYEVDSVSRKEESDWKMVYLARTEGSSTGSIKWKFDTGNSGLVVDSVRVVCRSQVFEKAHVVWLLCGGEVCMPIPPDLSEYETKELSGSTSLTLTAELSGGDGKVAWQHAQLFRQPLDNTSDYPLNVTLTLRQV